MFIISDTESNLVIRWRCYFRYRHHIMDAIYACVNTDTTIVKIMSTTPSPWRSDLTDRDQRAAGECHLMVIRRSPRPSPSLAANRPTESSPFLLPACSSGPFRSLPFLLEPYHRRVPLRLVSAKTGQSDGDGSYKSAMQTWVSRVCATGAMICIKHGTVNKSMPRNLATCSVNRRRT